MSVLFIVRTPGEAPPPAAAEDRVIVFDDTPPADMPGLIFAAERVVVWGEAESA